MTIEQPISPDGEDSREGSPNLLAHIAATIGSRQHENVATTALLYVMQNDILAGRAVVESLARAAELDVGVELPSALDFVGQDFGPDGRPDAVGLDPEGRKRVIIEAKIDAGFQLQQVARYSTRLALDVPCIIVILAPERRLPRLVREANGQLAQIEHDLVQRSATMYQSVDRKLTLLGISWTRTLEAMENASSSCDIAQLRGLYAYIDSVTFLPFAGADIASANGRLLSAITSVARNVAECFSTAERIDPYHRWGSFGHALRLNGRRVWFGVWLEGWAQRADTPYWLAYHRDSLPIAEARPLVSHLNTLPSIAAHHDGQFLCIALFPPLGVDRGDVEQDLVNRIRQVTELVPRGTS